MTKINMSLTSAVTSLFCHQVLFDLEKLPDKYFYSLVLWPCMKKPVI